MWIVYALIVNLFIVLFIVLWEHVSNIPQECCNRSFCTGNPFKPQALNKKQISALILCKTKIIPAPEIIQIIKYDYNLDGVQ